MNAATRKPLGYYLGQIPLTLWLVLAAVVLFFWPSANHLVEYDRRLVCGGEAWRIATCHLTHWNLDHLLWDALALGVLGVMCERRSRSRWLVCLIASAVAIPLAVLVLQPEMATYRGLSGLDTGLFTLLAVGMLREKWRDRDWTWLTIICLFIAGFAGKIVFELATGGTVFVDSTAANFTPAPLAHLVGLFVGSLVGMTETPAEDGVRSGILEYGNETIVTGTRAS